MKGQRYIVTLKREYKNHPNYQSVRETIDYILGVAVKNATLKKQWRFQVFDKPKAVKELGIYTVIRRVEFQKIGGHRRLEETQWEGIYNKLVRSAGWKRWSVESAHAPKKIVAAPSVAHVKDDTKDYAPINLEMADHFSHIFDRESQIRRIMAALRLAKQTQIQKRLHCVLYGPPGCGKSEIITAIGRMTGEEGEHYIKFDATSTTQAGAINILLNSQYIAPVLLVEEIEKTHPNDQRWMLGLLDQRAEIRQTNFRVGNRAKNVRVICIATCNDLALFQSVMSGALASRFTHKIKCPRPSREILHKILQREIGHLSNGNPAWIEPALDFAAERKITDPREVISICLSGQNDLLTGQYQDDYRKTTEDT